jgi:hypothetical protein
MKKRTMPNTQQVKHAPPGRHVRKDDGNAFFPDPGDGPAHTKDGLAQELAEEFLIEATSGEQVVEDALNAEVPEDEGGPFVITSEREEFAYGIDESNPAGSEREALPSAMRGAEGRPTRRAK